MVDLVVVDVVVVVEGTPMPNSLNSGSIGSGLEAQDLWCFKPSAFFFNLTILLLTSSDFMGIYCLS